MSDLFHDPSPVAYFIEGVRVSREDYERETRPSLLDRRWFRNAVRFAGLAFSLGCWAIAYHFAKGLLP